MLAIIAVLVALVAPPAPPESEIYVVVLGGGVKSEAVTERHGLAARRTYSAALRGFSAAMTPARAATVARDPQVAYVQRNVVHRATDTQANPPSWGLDRVDQRALPLDAAYRYPNGAAHIHAYVIDTGVRTTHADFGGRAESGFDAIDGGPADDCDGHGTHVAGTIAGTEHGVAKQIKVVAVRVLDCAGSGTTETVIAGVDWVTANAKRPAVANMSLGGNTDRALDDAVRRSVLAGITYAISAGNGRAGQPIEACQQSPARVAEVLTVTATDRSDTRAPWANYGTCVDLFAPGVSITSAYGTGDGATETLSGTSMSAPHVAGAAAIYLETHPYAMPAEVGEALVASATPDAVQNPLTGTPNRLLYIEQTSTQPAR